MTAVQNKIFNGLPDLKKEVTARTSPIAILKNKVQSWEGAIKGSDVTYANIEGLNAYNVLRKMLGMKEFIPPLFLINHHLHDLEQRYLSITVYSTSDQLKDLKGRMKVLQNKLKNLSQVEKKTQFYTKDFSPRYLKLAHKILNHKPGLSISTAFIEALTYAAPIYAAWKCDLVPVFQDYQYGWPLIAIAAIATEWLKHEAQGRIGNPLSYSSQLFQKHKWTVGIIAGTYFLKPHFPIFHEIWKDWYLLGPSCFFGLLHLKNKMREIDEAKSWTDKISLSVKSLAIGAAMGALVGFFMKIPIADANKPGTTMEWATTSIVNVTRNIAKRFF